MTSDSKYRVLSQSDIDSFLTNGFVHIKNCFTPSKADQWLSTMWTRLGLSPDSPSWPIERCNMALHTGEDVKTFAPRAWDAMCDLLGGPSRIRDQQSLWHDGLIVNLGDPDGDTTYIPPKSLDGWHVDGDFFTHFLDSPEQALLVIPLLTDVEEKQGPTVASPDAIPLLAKHLYDHPEGVTPRFTSTTSGSTDDMNFFRTVQAQCKNFIHCTGKAGDCYFLHPLTLHTASRNCLRIPRVILNPAVGLSEPFNFDRKDASEYSLVERKTLLALGKEEGLKGWKITGERKHVVPARIKLQAKLKDLELRRLRGEACEGERENGLGGQRLEEVNKLEVVA